MGFEVVFLGLMLCKINVKEKIFIDEFIVLFVLMMLEMVEEFVILVG